MKKLLLAVLVVLYGDAFGQQFPISAANMFSYSGGPSPSLEISTTPGMMKSANFNWGIAGVPDNNPSMVESLLQAAANNGIKLILEGALPDYAWAERLFFEGNQTYFYTAVGNHFADGGSTQPRNDQYYNQENLEATVLNGYMVDSVKYDPVDPWVLGASYKAYFRLKVIRSGTILPSQPRASIEIWDTQNNPNTEVTSRVLYDSSFASDNTYYDFELDFTPPSHSNGSSSSSLNTVSSVAQPEVSSTESRQIASQQSFPDGIDLRVWWFGNPVNATASLFLDDIRVDGTDGKSDFTVDSLFDGDYNSIIKGTAAEFDTYQALGRYYLKDEPYISQYLAYDYMNNVLDSVPVSHANGDGLGYTQKDENGHLHYWNWSGDPYKRYLREADPYELAAEVNRFLVQNGIPDLQPGTVGYTSMAQNEIQIEEDRFDSAQADCYMSQSGTWRAHINSSSWNNVTREPHFDEIRAQVYSALAHGAKGIDYFLYLTDVNDGAIGLVDPSLNEINASSTYEQGALGYSYGENKWECL